MKRKDLLRHLRNRGCQLLREGKKHSVFYNPANSKTSTVPRHREINDFTAGKVCRDLGIPEL
ncbi:MAG: type II toxin-antitoxin system HicA family toxin [Dehalococcoidia bacterium]|nr:MAG: type II toxin-antitoxin system HicA family toxin [Dehalococcoidia bacterium]